MAQNFYKSGTSWYRSTTMAPVAAVGTAVTAAIPGGLTGKEFAKSSMDDIKEMVKTSYEKPVMDAAQLYLKNKKIGKYGGKVLNIYVENNYAENKKVQIGYWDLWQAN
jgi:hypothetical protein